MISSVIYHRGYQIHMNIVKISGQYIFMYVCTYVSCTGNHYEVYLNFHISLKPMSLKNVGAIFLLATRFVNFAEEQKTSPYKDKSRKIADIDFFCLVGQQPTWKISKLLDNVKRSRSSLICQNS